MIEAMDLHKRFGAVNAVRGVSISAPDGQITGLLGPNGAGKTTILRMLCTLLAPDRGQVMIDGADASLDPLLARRRLGVLPDAKGLYRRLSCRENIEYFGRLQGMDETTLQARVIAVLDELGLTAIADRRVEGFSQGQRVKTAIARALVHAPGNLLLDEPTNGLDVMSTRAMRDTLRGLRDQGRCIVLTSHIMQEVAALCDRIIVVSAGGVVASGRREELLALSGEASLEDAFVRLIGSGEGLMS